MQDPATACDSITPQPVPLQAISLEKAECQSIRSKSASPTGKREASLVSSAAAGEAEPPLGYSLHYQNLDRGNL
jgi:hypothetical protein